MSRRKYKPQPQDTAALHKILTSVPVNGTTNIVMNQSGCDEKLHLNRLVVERRQLQENVRVWMNESQQSIKRKHELRPVLRKASERLAHLNQILKGDERLELAKRFKTFNDVFVYVAKRNLNREVLDEILRQVREIWVE